MSHYRTEVLVKVRNVQDTKNRCFWRRSKCLSRVGTLNFICVLDAARVLALQSIGTRSRKAMKACSRFLLLLNKHLFFFSMFTGESAC